MKDLGGEEAHAKARKREDRPAFPSRLRVKSRHGNPGGETRRNQGANLQLLGGSTDGCDTLGRVATITSHGNQPDDLAAEQE